MALSLRATPTRGDQTPDSPERIASEIADIVTQLETDFQERDQLYRDIDDVLYQTLPVEIPDAYRSVTRERRSSLAVDMTNTITSAWTINPPETQFRPVSFGDAAQENSTLREHFFDASWRRQVKEAGGNVYRSYAHAVVTKGEGVLKTIERTQTAWAAYQARAADLMGRLTDGDLRRLDGDAKDRVYRGATADLKRAAPYPIQTLDVPPETFRYWRRDGVGTTLACEVKQVPYLEALLKFDAGLTGEGRVVAGWGESRPSTLAGSPVAASEWRSAMSGVPTLTLIELWRKRYVDYVLLGPRQDGGKGTLVKRLRHGYGDPVTGKLRGPYFHTLGQVTSSRLPGRAGLGVLFGYLSLFPMLDTLRTIQQTNAVMTGWAAYAKKTPPGTGLPAPYGDDGLPPAEEAEPIRPGYLYPYDVGPVEQPEGGRALGETIQSIQQELQGILPPVLQGVTAESDSGYEYNQAVYLARTKWSAPIQNIEQTLADRVGFESWLIENRIGETVYAWGAPPRGAAPRRTGGDQGWLGVGPEDLNGVHTYEVHLNPETPSNEVIKIRSHVEMVQAEFEGIDDAREDLGKNPDEVERAILLRKIKETPQVKDFLMRRMLQKLGQGEAVAQAVAQEKLAGMDGAPPGGFANGAPDVFQPGQAGMPLAPTAPGPSAAPGGGQGLPASPAGAPGGTPATNVPIPGQGGQP